MSIITLNMRSATIIKVAGAQTQLTEYSSLSRRIEELLANDKTNLLVDLSELSDFDSTFVGELIRCLLKTKEKDGQMKLLKPSKRLRNRLTITHLNDAFEIFEEQSEALASFA
jgi:anti-sigma B factor antagonist